MIIRKSVLLLTILVLCRAEDETIQTTSTQPSAASTLGTLFRQARSEHYYGSSGSVRYGDDPVSPRAADPLEHRDSAYFESRCITCDPNKVAASAAVVPADRDPYGGRWRQRGKYDYYDDEYDDRRYRDRYDPYYDRARAPAYDYDRYDPYGRNELFRPSSSTYDRYDPYERDRYYTRPDRPIERPEERPLIDRPVVRPVERPVADRPYDRSYERGNGWDNLDTRYPYDDRYDRYAPPRRPPYEDYGPPRGYDKYNANRGRYDPRYDRYDPYERNGYGRRPPIHDDPRYDDRYDRYGGGSGGRLPPPDSRNYYASGAGGGGWSAPGGDRPSYASAWNYGGNRDTWRDPSRDRDRERDRDRDRDGGYYRPRDYFYDSTAAPGGSRGTSYLYDRPESSTKPDADKPTNSPQTQDSGKTYKD